MRALVVYESMFGNTRDIAVAIAAGIAAGMPVETIEVAAAPTSIPDDVDLLVVGGPTHAHGMTKPESRADSARRAGDRLVSRGDGIREWLQAVRGP
jgi:flavodoxin